MIAVEGNHEIETQLDGTTFAAYKARFGNDVTTLGGSGSPFYFSVDVPGAHIVVLGAYGADYSVGSAQVTPNTETMTNKYTDQHAVRH